MSKLGQQQSNRCVVMTGHEAHFEESMVCMEYCVLKRLDRSVKAKAFTKLWPGQYARVLAHQDIFLSTFAQGGGSACKFQYEEGHLGRRKGISRSGLSTVLDELKKKDFPDATSRQTIKRRRDADVDVQTRYGKLLQDWKVTLLPVGKTKKKSGSVTRPKETKTVEFPFVQPIPLLCHICLECPEFSNMMLKVLDLYTPSQSSPLSLICYSDGISPGNVLAHNQTRKECVYLSIN